MVWQPLLSICIPAYNCERWIGDCLESVVSQQGDQYEVIVIDDGSTDLTGIIADDYAQRHSSISVLHKENGGLIRARVDAIGLARGEYVVSLDGDDVLLPGSIEDMEGVLKKEGPDILTFDFESFGASGRKSHSNASAGRLLLEGSRQHILHEFFCTKKLNSACFKAIRHSLFETERIADALDVRMGEDWFVSLYPMLNATTFGYRARPYYGYRMHGSSMTDSYDYSYWKTLILMYEHKSAALGEKAAGICTKDEIDMALLSDLAKCIAYVHGRPRDKERYCAMLRELRQNELLTDVYQAHRDELPPLYRVPLRLLHHGHDQTLFRIKDAVGFMRARM